MSDPAIVKLPLDQSFYSLDPEEEQFLVTLTGIADTNKLKEHICTIQRDAYEIYDYPCIRNFAFTKLKIFRLPVYQHVLQLGQERPGAIFLDIGCCFGNDIRKLVLDGFPVKQVIASDISTDFWSMGHKLFKSTPETFPALFIQGDVFDSNFISAEPICYTEKGTTQQPDLSSLQSLTPLHGHISAIHASSLFHLFDEAQQTILASRLGSLLSPVPGSIIFGSHGGLHEKGEFVGFGGRKMFCHSSQTWKDLWDGQIFTRGSVQVEATISEPHPGFLLLIWSVKRL